jgi:glutamyl-tRNA reductase
VNTVCVGISHQTAPAELRTRLRFSADDIRSALPRIRALGLSECVLFSTDHRTELYVTSDEGSPPIDSVVNFLAMEKTGEASVPAKSFFTVKGTEAAEHLLRVSTGLESMIVGDTEIFGALKEGFAIARESGTVGFLLDRLFTVAWRAHKLAKDQTLISEGAISVSEAAVELAQRIFDDLTEKRALIVGAGETAQLTAKQLQARGIRSLIITHRNAERAENLASLVGGVTVAFETLREQLPKIDIIVASLQSELHVLTSKDIREIEKSRHGRTLFLIDCGVPHNIDPFAGELENVFLYDLDTLNAMVSENIAQRRTHLPAVETMILDEVKGLVTWYASLESSPTIEALKLLMEKIRTDEIAKEIHRFKPQDRKAIDELTKRITDRIVQIPAEHLKTGRESRLPNRHQSVNLVRRLFGLDAGEKDTPDTD